MDNNNQAPMKLPDNKVMVLILFIVSILILQSPILFVGGLWIWIKLKKSQYSLADYMENLSTIINTNVEHIEQPFVEEHIEQPLVEEHIEQSAEIPKKRRKKATAPAPEIERQVERAKINDSTPLYKKERLSKKQQLRQAVIMKEILDKPLSLREDV